MISTVSKQRFRGQLAWIVTVSLCLVVCSPAPAQTGATQSQTSTRIPRIKPDYTEVELPCNIAPMNFSVLEPCRACRATVQGRCGEKLEVTSRDSQIRFPLEKWRQLLDANKGKPLSVQVAVQQEDAKWVQFAPFTNHVSPDPIDPILIYRKIHPVHDFWGPMGLYQRDLHSFKETPILENQRYKSGCSHCHALDNNDPNNLMILVRSVDFTNCAILVRSNQACAIQGTVGFSAYHPKSSMVILSFNRPRYILHSAKQNDMRDVGEVEGWLGSCELGSNVVHKLAISDGAHVLDFPAWSPDGAWLFYCSALKDPNGINPTNSEFLPIYDIQYDLMRVPYDQAAKTWGQPQVVISSKELGMSVTQPRVSPDGHWLYFSSARYGCWPTHDPFSDIYGMDLEQARQTGRFECHKLDINSDQTESIVNWSSNSKWIVFSSKRGNPLFTRPYLAHVAPDGRNSKPIVVPQEDPALYDSYLFTYTFPSLATGPVTVPQKDIVRAIKSPNKPKFDIRGAK